MPNSYLTFELISKLIAGVFTGAFFGCIPLAVGIVRQRILPGVICQVVCVLFSLSMLLIFNQPFNWTLLLAGVMAAGLFILTKKKK